MLNMDLVLLLQTVKSQKTKFTIQSSQPIQPRLNQLIPRHNQQREAARDEAEPQIPSSMRNLNPIVPAKQEISWKQVPRSNGDFDVIECLEQLMFNEL